MHDGIIENSTTSSLQTEIPESNNDETHIEDFFLDDYEFFAPIEETSILQNQLPASSNILQSQKAIDAPATVSTNQYNQLRNGYKPASHFSDLERQMILSEITSHPHSISTLAKYYNLDPTIIYYWAKKSEMELPTQSLIREIVDNCTPGEDTPAILAQKSGRNVSTIRTWLKQNGKVLPRKYSKKIPNSEPSPSSTITNELISNLKSKWPKLCSDSKHELSLRTLCYQYNSEHLLKFHPGGKIN